MYKWMNTNSLVQIRAECEQMYNQTDRNYTSYISDEYKNVISSITNRLYTGRLGNKFKINGPDRSKTRKEFRVILVDEI